MNRIDRYLMQCRIRSPFENPEVHVPPTPTDVHDLMKELRRRNLSPAIVGSVAVFRYLQLQEHEYRPTCDLDIWVSRHPGQPLAGWKRDESSPGIESWISPAAGWVDFLIAGQVLVNGNRSPLHVRRAAPADDATLMDLIAMKLNTFREKDLLDAILLVRRLGQIPGRHELGKLNQLQHENLELVRMWIEREAKGRH